MWHLYILMSMLAAGITLKLVHPLIGKGRLKHDGAITQDDRRLALILVLVMPLLSLPLYLGLGRPDMPGAPAIFAGFADQNAQHTSLLAERPLRILIEKNPNDVGALISLALVNQRIARYDDAEAFFQRALMAAEKAGDWRLRPAANMMGEMQVEAAGGIVTEKAHDTFLYVQKLHPENPIARYYIGLWKYQQGQVQEALDDWVALINEGPPNIHWKARVRDGIAMARADLRRHKDK